MILRLTWQFQFIENTKTFPEAILKQIIDVFRDGFSLPEGWDLASVQEALRRSKVLGLLVSKSNEIAGYAFYSVPSTTLNNKYFLWEDAICLKKEVQGQGYANAQLFKKVCDLFPERTFGWVGGRTQNPMVILRYAHLGEVLPFDMLYSKKTGKHIMRFLLAHIAEVQQAYTTQRLDMSTGICYGVYSEGRLGDYITKLAGTERFEHALATWGFERHRGDAVLVVVHLDKPIKGNSEYMEEKYDNTN